MAGKKETPVGTKPVTAAKPRNPRATPDPKPGAKAASAAKPAAEKAFDQHAFAGDPSGKGKGLATSSDNMSELQRMRIELIAYSLIYDIFTLHSALAALGMEDLAGEDYFVQFYCSRMRVLLTDDKVEGNIGTLLDLGAWMAIKNNSTSTKVQDYFSGLVKPTDEQIRKLIIEAAHCQSNRDRTPRGELWMGSNNEATRNRRRAHSHHIRVTDDPTLDPAT